MQVRRENPHHGKVRVRIIADQAGVGPPTVSQHHLNPLSPMHHMAVGQHEAIGRNHESRATPLLVPVSSAHFDVHHRRSHLLRRAHNRLRVGVQ